ncbi:MAG: aminopeptidase P family protein, partial [Clostridia bacterium]|nr:aminopeptidase P family protein [Clostridia bacterium]
TDSRYIEAAEQTIRHMTCQVAGSLSEAVKALADAHGITAVLGQSEGLTCGDFARWEKALAPVRLIADGALDREITRLRSVKTPDEIRGLKQAQALTDDGFRYILERIEPGRTEREIALDLEFYIRRQGAEGVSFEFIVVSGENTSLPHGVPGDRVIRRGDFVTMDFGALWKGLHADMTRTVAVGDVSDEQRAVYETVRRAQQACLDVLKPGLSGAEADAAARDIITAAGYGDCFGHGTGHGVGFDIHESPTLSPRSQDKMLQIGQVVTVEPGIYLPGKFGVRIEDMAHLIDGGIQNLTRSEKSLIIL